MSDYLRRMMMRKRGSCFVGKNGELNDTNWRLQLNKHHAKLKETSNTTSRLRQLRDWNPKEPSFPYLGSNTNHCWQTETPNLRLKCPPLGWKEPHLWMSRYMSGNYVRRNIWQDQRRRCHQQTTRWLALKKKRKRKRKKKIFFSFSRMRTF